MDEVLWEMSWENATMYLAMIPELLESTKDKQQDEIKQFIKPEDELKHIKLGKF